MKAFQQDRLHRARNSLSAAKLLHAEGYHEIAASRAYYVMFYVAEALLATKGLQFTKHGAVHSAFGQQFAKVDPALRKFHRYLIRAMEVRHIADYAAPGDIPENEAAEQVERAAEFLRVAEQMLGPILGTNRNSP